MRVYIYIYRTVSLPFRATNLIVTRLAAKAAKAARRGNKRHAPKRQLFRIRFRPILLDSGFSLRDKSLSASAVK